MFNKSVNLVSTKISSMKLSELFTISKDPEASNHWISSQKHILFILTSGGTAVILLWQLFDKFYVEAMDYRLPWLRWIMIAVFAVNLFLGLKRAGERAIKQHIVAGFYLGTIFCMLLTMFTGASESPYWFGLFFIIVSWFVLVPYNFREMIIHSFVFVLIFIIGQYSQQEFIIVDHEMGKIIFLYSVTLLVSFFAAYIRNQLDASNLRIKKELELKNIELNTKNKELKKFRLVLDQAPGAVFIIDKHSKFEYINPFFTQISGYSEEDLIHKNINDTLYRGITEIPESRKEVISILSEGKSWQGELPTIHKNGSKYWANTIASPYKNDQNEIDGFIVIQQDITEKREIEKALQESELKYKTLVENSLEGITIIRDNKIIFTNDTFCKMVGYTRDELYQMPSMDLIYEEDRSKAQKIAGQRRSRDFSTINEVFRLMHKNGEIKECETTSTLIEFEGKWSSFFTSRDITESKKMQEALKRSEQKYRELSEMLPQTVYELDTKGNIIYFNQTGYKQFGIDDSDLGSSAFRFISPDQHEKLRQNIGKTLEERKATSGNKYIAVRKNGETFPAMTFTAPIIYHEEVTGIRGIILDMTDNVAMENALLESEEKYRTLVENSQDGIIITQDGKFKFANSAMCQMLGYTLDEFYAMDGADILPAHDRERILKIHADRMKGMIKSLNYPSQLITKEDKIVDVDIHSSTVEYEGKPAAFMTLHDITESKKMQQALLESEEKYRTLIDKATDGIVITQHGRIKFANSSMCTMMQYQLEELLEQPYLNYVMKEDHDEMVNFHKRRMEGEYFTSIYRSRFIPKDGKIITMELNARTSEYNGEPAAFIVIRNITERLKIEQELQQAKTELEKLNRDLEGRVLASSQKLTEANTQLIKLQKENLQSQFEVLRQQVNPHFLFNSLNVLTSLIKLEPDLAEKFTEHLSKVYRYVLENKDNDLVNLYTELDFLDAYIFLLNIRFMDKIEVNVSIPDNKRDLLILPLALQLLIENAIKHNSMSKKNPLKIEILIEENNILNVVNNLQERESHMASTGVGLKNIEHRYYLLEMPAPEFIKTETNFIARIPLKS